MDDCNFYYKTKNYWKKKLGSYYFSDKNKIKMLRGGTIFFYWSFKSPSDNSFQGHANGQLRKRSKGGGSTQYRIATLDDNTKGLLTIVHHCAKGQ